MFGSICSDEYEDLEDVIDWLLGVVTFNLFVNQVDVDESTMWDETQNVVLPRYLFRPQPRAFWLAICSILKLMTKDCIQTQFLTTDLKHKELVESVLVLLDKESDSDPAIHTNSKPLNCKDTVFWPALQCFVLLLEKLGSRFWMFTRTAPNTILKLIKSNPYYQEQLEICYSEAARFEIPNIEDGFTFSQLVFDNDTFAQSSMQPPKQRYHGFSLSWIVPFIKSLIDYGDFELPTIVELLTFVCHIHNVSLHGDVDISSTDMFQNVLPIDSIIERIEKLFLPQESLSSISQSVGILFSRKIYSALLDCKQTVFYMVTALCSHLLSKSNQLQSRHKPYLSQTARTYISLVMYCSTEKTACDLWYLLKMVSPLSPFLSVVSNEKSSATTINFSLLSRPADLSEVLLKMITDKLKEQDDLSGPFLYPPSSTEGSKWFGSCSAVIVKQEPVLDEPCKSSGTDSTEVEQKPLVDQCTLENHSSSAELESLMGNTTRKQNAGVKIKPFALQLEKLPVQRRHSDGYPVVVNKSIDSEPDTIKCTVKENFKLDLQSDTESCSADDEDDDLPNFFSFSNRRRKHVGTATSDDESCEENNVFSVQKHAQKVASDNNGNIKKQISGSSTITLDDENCEGSSISRCGDVFIADFQDKESCMQRHASTTSTITLGDEQHEGGGQMHVPDLSVSSLDDETSVMQQQISVPTVRGKASENSNKSNVQKICDAASDVSPLKKKIRVEHEKTFDNAIGTAFVDMTANDSSSISSLNVKQTKECIGNSASLIDLVLSNTTCQYQPTQMTDSRITIHSAQSNVNANPVSKSFSLPISNVSIKIEDAKTTDKVVEEDASTFGSNRGLNQKEADMNLSDGDSDCFVVTPIKHENLKFEQKVSVDTTGALADADDASHGDAELIRSVECIDQDLQSNVQEFQPPPMQPFPRKTSLPDGKLQPAVVGRAPFSKSRMASLQTPETHKIISRETITKGNVMGNDRGTQKKVANSKSTCSASIMTGTPKVVVAVELSKSHDKEEFLMEVLHWSPVSFFQNCGNASEGPHCTPTIQDVPLTFKSSDQYVEVFKSLLLLETWDTVSVYCLLYK